MCRELALMQVPTNTLLKKNRNMSIFVNYLLLGVSMNSRTNLLMKILGVIKLKRSKNVPNLRNRKICSSN
ncbi:hypothetical protein JTB14_032739 [Gonioctena quinquepunctata]|nr:hypothetical protein JTB14_032739 [Gonioctena quinquepunctata]